MDCDRIRDRSSITRLGDGENGDRCQFGFFCAYPLDCDAMNIMILIPVICMASMLTGSTEPFINQ
jgi:hypothetical protein